MKLPARVESWWTGQGGEIARREAMWAWGWVRSREGAVLIVGLAVCAVGSNVAKSLYMWQLDFTFAVLAFPLMAPPPPYIFEFYAVLQIAVPLTYYALFLVLALKPLSYRIWPLFRSDRLRDLLVSGIEPRSLWPGLLMGPVVVWTCAATLTEAGVLAATVIPVGPEMDFETWGLVYAGKTMDPATLDPWVIFLSGWGRWIGSPIFVAISLIGGVFATAAAARFTIMKASKLRGYLGAFAALYLTLWVRDGIVEIPVVATANRIVLTLVWIRPLLQGFISLGLLCTIIWLLRRPRLWERVRDKAESIT